MSGGSTETTQTVELPEWYNDFAKYVTEQAQAAQQIGYVPYMGPSVAAYTPAQEAAFNNVNSAAGSYGMQTAAMAPMPSTVTSSNGVVGYSDFPIYQDSLKQLQAYNPTQYGLLMGYQPQPTPITKSKKVPGSTMGG